MDCCLLGRKEFNDCGACVMGQCFDIDSYLDECQNYLNDDEESEVNK